VSPRILVESGIEATVVEAQPNAMFKLLCSTGETILGHLAGTMRVQATRLLPGDKVLVEVSPLDHGKGRITARR